MKLLHLSLICLVMVCSSARAQSEEALGRAVRFVEQHVSDWSLRGYEPDHRDDSGYRALFADLQSAGVILAGEAYSSGLIGRTYNFLDNKARPHLSVRTQAGSLEGYEFFVEHGAAGTRVTTVKRFTIQPGVSYISVPVKTL